MKVPFTCNLQTAHKLTAAGEAVSLLMTHAGRGSAPPAKNPHVNQAYMILPPSFELDQLRPLCLFFFQ